jgi:RNA polymerase sigma factor (TIGR02999 family)
MSKTEITKILCGDGGREAVEQVMTLLYDDLKRLARGKLRGRDAVTLNTTGLLHETYLKLVRRKQMSCESRGHFLAIVATAMRQIVIDYARRQQAEKRGGGRQQVELEEAEQELGQEAESMIAIDQALHRLAAFDKRLSRLVECRVFAGFSAEETATALGVSRATVMRDWARARAWLKEEIGETGV